MKIRFLRAAQIELYEAVDYYDYEQPGLGSSFLQEMMNTLDRVGKFPDAWPPCSKRTGRCILRRFPYAALYQVRNDEILIVAIAHLHQRPERWNTRIQFLEDRQFFTAQQVRSKRVPVRKFPQVSVPRYPRASKVSPLYRSESGKLSPMRSEITSRSAITSRAFPLSHEMVSCRLASSLLISST